MPPPVRPTVPSGPGAPPMRPNVPFAPSQGAGPPPAVRPTIPSPPAAPPPARPTAGPTVVTPRVEPPAPPPMPEAPPAPAPKGPARPGNPFLSQDPSAKAKRLARALISDLAVYYPDRRKEGLRAGTLKQLFEEEIKKSWEEYTEQVGKDLAESTTFFTDALNEILASGQKVF